MKKFTSTLLLACIALSTFATPVLNKKGFKVGNLENGVITLSVNMPNYDYKKLQKMYVGMPINLATDESYSASDDIIYNDGMRAKKRTSGWIMTGVGVLYLWPLMIPGIIHNVKASKHKQFVRTARMRQ